MNITTTIEIPQEIMFSLRESESDLIKDMKKITALKYYVEKRLSLGQSALLAEMSEKKFINYLSDQNISIFSYSSKDELLKDMDNA